MSRTRLVEATGVTKRFGHLTANAGIDLHVEPGEVVGLLGANGAGKSTFMRLLLGLIRPDSGRIRLFGDPPSRATRGRIGYVPQGLGLYEDLTVTENLEFAASAFHFDVPRLDDSGLAAQRDTLVRDLPLGLRRRLAFAAALAHRPSLLVLDEPTSGVDPLARGHLWDTVRDAADRGAGVLVSTHYMEEVEHCDRVVVLAAGRAVLSGTVEAIIADRRALEIRTEQWQPAFQALDDSGLATSLHGRTLRLPDADAAHVSHILRSSGVDAEVVDVPATFEEAFVAIATEGRRR